MAIETHETEGTTSFLCDCCGSEAQSGLPDGKAPEAWGTGRLRLDLSVSEEVEFQLCFCPACAPDILKPVCPRLMFVRTAEIEDYGTLTDATPGGIKTADEQIPGVRGETPGGG